MSKRSNQERQATAERFTSVVSNATAPTIRTSGEDVVALSHAEAVERGITNTDFRGLLYACRFDSACEGRLAPHWFILSVEYALGDRDRVSIPGGERGRAAAAFLALCNDPAFGAATITLCTQSGAIDPAIIAQRKP